MSFAETHRVHGIRCDKGGCAEEITGPDMKLFIGHRHYEQLAQEQGWTIWTGRSRRIYCPRHGPTKGHGMTCEKAVDGNG